MTDHNPSPTSGLYSEEGEEAFLASVFINSACLNDVLGYLKPDDFYFLRNQVLYQACLNLHSRRESIDIISIEDELRQMKQTEMGGSYLTYLLSNYATAMHAETYARIVKRIAVRRHSLRWLSEIQAALASEELGTDEALAKAQQVLNNGFQEIQVSRVSHQADVVSEVFDEGLRAQDGWEEDRLATGLLDLDYWLDGGLDNDWLVVVAAPAKSGKTTLMLQIAQNAVRQKNKQTGKQRKILVFSREMSAKALVHRMVTQETADPAYDLAGLTTGQQKRKMEAQQWSRFVDATGRLSDHPIFYDCRSATMTEVAATATRLHQAQGIDLIVADYIQIFSPADLGKGFNREQQVAHISASLKRLAMELGVPVLAGSQLNKQGETRESMGITNDLDLLIRIEVPDGMEPTQKGKRLLRIDAFRHGPMGSVPCFYDPSRLYFGDLVE